MNRSAYLIIIVAIVALGIAAGFFLHYRAAPQPAPAIATSTPTGGSLPQVAPQSLQSTQASTPVASQGPQNFGVISDSQALGYFVDAMNAVTIITPEGRIIKIVSGNSTTLSDNPIPNLFSASFSFDGKFVLALLGDPSSPRTMVFDTSKRIWRTLTINAARAAWSPAKDQFAYLAPQSSGVAIKAWGATTGAGSALLSFNVLDLDIAWTDTSHLVLAEKPSALVPGSAWIYDLKKLTLAPIATDTAGLMVNWNGAKNMGIAFTGGGKGGLLSFIDMTTGVTKNFSFLTLPSKCAFDNSVAPASSTVLRPTLYCAIPRASDAEFRNAALPDDYLKRAVFTVDDIVSINLSSGETRAIWSDPNRAIDATDLRVVNGKVFFLNRYDQKLYAVDDSG